MPVDPQQFLRELFATAIDAAHPQQVLEAICLKIAAVG